MQGCERALSLSLTGEEGVCGYALQGCAHPLHWSEREREREREREKEERGEGGRDVKYVHNCHFLFLKGMTGALAPFSYLVLEI